MAKARNLEPVMRITFGSILASLALVGGCGASGGQKTQAGTDTDGGTGINLDSGGTLDLDTNTTVVATEADPETATGGCGEVQVVVEPITPTIVLLVDQSGSMTTDFDGMQRWDAVYETLMDPVDGVVSQLQSEVRFGLTLYSSMDGNEGGQCPMLTSVPPALDNAATIDAVYAPADPIDETPTGESLAITAMELGMFAEPGPKGIVLATDGEPDTCAEPNPQNGQQEALDAAALAFDLGIKTFIVSVGDEVGEQHQQEMANVGVGKAPDDPNPAPYYEALDAQQLVEAFKDIIGSFVSCQLIIDGEVDLEKACDGTVMLDGMELECDVDWHLPDPSTLELLGDACETLQDGNNHTVSATWPCGAVNIP